MADRVGKKRATVTNFLRLLRLPAEVQAALKVDKISVGHAKALLSLPTEEDQLDLCKRAILGDWSVRTLEQKVKDYDRERPAKIKSDPIPQEFDAVKSIMGRYCDNNVVMKRSANGATSVTMKFKSDEQMELFMQAIGQL
jgi:ParB family chromosome partitioning protein